MRSFVLILILAGLGLAQSPITPTDLALDYQIGPDDLIDVSVFGVPELAATTRVSASGFITLPLVGNIKALGLDSVALSRKVEEALKNSYVNDPHVTVSVREYLSRPVTVIGAVRSPGVFQLRHPKPLFDVVMLAGGFADNAGPVIQITRASARLRDDNGSPGVKGAPNVVSVNREDVLQTNKPESNLLIYLGDLISVPPTPVVGSVFLIGEVAKPAEYPLKSGRATVRQAILYSGGFTKQAKPKECTIIRYHPDGSMEKIIINLEDIMRASLDDMPLMPNDVLYVPSKKGPPAVSRFLQISGAAVLTQAVYFLLR